MLESIILGIVQGLTEFLPISSTAHLRIVPALCGWEDRGAAFTAVIQIGTLAAVLAYFRRDIAEVAVAWTQETLRGQCCRSFAGKLGWMMIVATVPIVVAGLLFENYIEHQWRSLYVICGSLAGLALLLWAAELFVKAKLSRGERLTELRDVTWWDAMLVGCAQAVALVPGSSRSGTTITGALFLGLSRETAARFSFLLSLPAVLAAGVYKLYKQRSELLASQADVANLVVATVVSGVVGYVSIAFLLAYLRTRTTHLFIIYRLVLAAVLLALLLTGRLGA